LAGKRRKRSSWVVLTNSPGPTPDGGHLGKENRNTTNRRRKQSEFPRLQRLARRALSNGLARGMVSFCRPPRKSRRTGPPAIRSRRVDVGARRSRQIGDVAGGPRQRSPAGEIRKQTGGSRDGRRGRSVARELLAVDPYPRRTPTPRACRTAHRAWSAPSRTSRNSPRAPCGSAQGCRAPAAAPRPPGLSLFRTSLAGRACAAARWPTPCISVVYLAPSPTGAGCVPSRVFADHARRPRSGLCRRSGTRPPAANRRRRRRAYGLGFPWSRSSRQPWSPCPRTIRACRFRSARRPAARRRGVCHSARPGAERNRRSALATIGRLRPGPPICR